MLRVTIDFIPYGDESKLETLSTIEIVNDGTGNKWWGNYDINDGEFYTRLEGFYRDDGHRSLVADALHRLNWQKAVSGRNGDELGEMSSDD